MRKLVAAMLWGLAVGGTFGVLLLAARIITHVQPSGLLPAALTQQGDSPVVIVPAGEKPASDANAAAPSAGSVGTGGAEPIAIAVTAPISDGVSFVPSAGTGPDEATNDGQNTDGGDNTGGGGDTTPPATEPGSDTSTTVSDDTTKAKGPKHAKAKVKHVAKVKVKHTSHVHGSSGHGSGGNGHHGSSTHKGGNGKAHGPKHHKGKGKHHH